MSTGEHTIWRLVQRCAQDLTTRGVTPFTRRDLIACVQRHNSQYEPDSINPIIQGITDNLQGGAPGAVGKEILHSVGRGQFVLKNTDRVGVGPGTSKPERNKVFSSSSTSNTTPIRYELVVQCNKCGSTERFLIPPPDNDFLCSKCMAKFDHLTVEPVRGFLYILSNPSMPGLLKIGMTEGDVSERIKQLSSGTGVAEPFVLEAQIISADPLRDERIVHERLAPYRKPNREFFELSVRDAVATLQQVLSRAPTYVRSDSLLQVTERSQLQQTAAPNYQVDADHYGSRYKYTCPECGTISRIAYANRHPRCRQCKRDLDWVHATKKKAHPDGSPS